MKCYICREKDAAEGSAFCSAWCADKYKAGRRWKICIGCGAEFLTQKKQSKRNYCERCIYRKHFAAPISPNKQKNRPETPPEDSIRKVIEEQQEIQRKTGKRISYGEIMAAKENK